MPNALRNAASAVGDQRIGADAIRETQLRALSGEESQAIRLPLADDHGWNGRLWELEGDRGRRMMTSRRPSRERELMSILVTASRNALLRENNVLRDGKCW
ncbi:MAG: hypothetical protein NZ523_02705 [Elioraea sp.]|nr:hypothetical protein [Elioraea sp.]